MIFKIATKLPHKTSRENELNFPASVTAPHQKAKLKARLGHFAHSSLILFQGGGKKCKIWPQFFNTVDFKDPGFQKTMYLKFERGIRGANDCPIFYPHLIWVATSKSEK